MSPFAFWLAVTGVTVGVAFWVTLRLLPTRRLALVVTLPAVVVVAVGIVRWTGGEEEDEELGGWPALVAFNVGLWALATVDGLAAIRPQRLAVTREVPPGITLGSESELTWMVHNPARRKVRIGLADELAPSLRASSRRVTGQVPARGRLRASVTLRPARRGRFEPSRIAVRVYGPLGLAARQADLDVPGELRVLPSFKSKDDAELRVRKARLLEVGLRSARGRGGGTEFEQLQEYSVDEEFRRIDWAATARVGKPIVRTYRAERNQTVLVLLDNGRVMAGRVNGVPRVEHAMDAVMALTTVATGLGDHCGLVVFDRDVQALLSPRHGRSQVGRVAETLCEVEPALVESDYAGAFTETLARFRRRTMLVVLTDLVEQSANEWLMPALPLILKEHLVVVAGVSDPDVERWRGPIADHDADSSAAYRRVAAVGASNQRERVVKRLRGLGATVVDSRPGHLAGDLADTYLEIKATGRL